MTRAPRPAVDRRRLLLTSLYLPGSSKIGVGHQVHGLARALVSRGHEVTVASPDEPGEDATYERWPLPAGPPARLVRVPWAVRHLDLGGFDVVHAHGEDWLLPGHRRRPPVVRTLLGSGISEALHIRGARERSRMAFIGASEMVASARADRTTAISAATMAVYPWVDRLVPCGVDTSAFAPDGSPLAEQPTILFVGTFGRRKRGRLLWEAFRDVVRPALPEARLWMVCSDAPAAPGVEVLGRIPQRELEDRYRAAWAFCLPSSYEGFGVPYVEAMAAGTPVVATPNPGALEVLDGGRLGVITDPSTLGRALVDLLADPGRRAELADAGLEAAARYDWSSVAADYEEVYAELLEERARTSSARGGATAGGGRPRRLGVDVVERPAVFASSFHPHLGGVEELVRQLAHAQTAAGLDPVVHTMRWPRTLPGHERVEGIEVRRHAYRAPEGDPARVARAVASNPAVLASVVGQLRADRADLVHVQCVHHGAWFAHQAARLLGLPVVVTLQGELTMDADRIFETSPTLRHTLRSLLRDADRVTACSAATLAEAEAWAGLELGDRGSVVPNGVDPGELSDPGPPLEGLDGPYLAALGRLVPQKGFDVLLRAFALAAAAAVGDGAVGGSSLPEGWRLALAGDGQERADLEDLADRLGVADRTVFVGPADRPTVARLLGHASLFVLPSRHEPFGIVTLEAMAAGAPVVATRVGGVPEVVTDGIDGVLVPSDDPAALASAIVGLAHDPGRRATLAEAGRRTAADHAWPAVELRYRDVYRQAVAHHAGRTGASSRRTR